jgi:FKBP-type peptidyl-prolyl cis-trans isomerase
VIKCSLYAARMTKLALVALAALAIAGCQKAESNNVAEAAANAVEPAPAAPATETNAAAIQSGNFTTASGLRFETLTPGTGPSPRLGDPVMVAYEGRLTDGTLFDSSAEPVPMVVGQLIPGFDEGLMLMRKGGRYRLRIPPELGYGPQGAGGGVIPPNATLDFTVTLVDVGGQGAAQPLAPEGN